MARPIAPTEPGSAAPPRPVGRQAQPRRPSHGPLGGESVGRGDLPPPSRKGEAAVHGGPQVAIGAMPHGEGSPGPTPDRARGRRPARGVRRRAPGDPGDLSLNPPERQNSTRDRSAAPRPMNSAVARSMGSTDASAAATTCAWATAPGNRSASAAMTTSVRRAGKTPKPMWTEAPPPADGRRQVETGKRRGVAPCQGRQIVTAVVTQPLGGCQGMESAAQHHQRVASFDQRQHQFGEAPRPSGGATRAARRPRRAPRTGPRWPRRASPPLAAGALDLDARPLPGGR